MASGNMNVSLTPELQRFVADKIKSGTYSSASEVVSDALRLLEEQDRTRGQRLTEFNDEVRERLASLDRGEFVELVDARQKLERKSEARRSQQL
jgi:antitoxin ParD1/3/4